MIMRWPVASDKPATSSVTEKGSRMKTATLAALAGATLFAAGAAQAAPTIFFGENTAVPFTIGAAPAAARASFLSGLSGGVGNQGFEAIALNTVAPLNIAFPGSTGSITATITGNGRVRNASNDSPGNGRFNTTPGGSQWWTANAAFSIDFSSPIAAFGFYGTDIGDFDGQVTVALLGTNNVTTSLTIGSTINAPNASALFWGFIDSSMSYTRITFGNTASGFDSFGFDDFVIGDAQQILPPPPPPPGTVSTPATLALAGLGLMAAGVASRRRRA
jgi:hypothetical protein